MGQLTQSKYAPLPKMMTAIRAPAQNDDKGKILGDSVKISRYKNNDRVAKYTTLRRRRKINQKRLSALLNQFILLFFQRHVSQKKGQFSSQSLETTCTPDAFVCLLRHNRAAFSLFVRAESVLSCHESLCCSCQLKHKIRGEMGEP